MATTVEALGLLEPAMWTLLYPGFQYDPARFRSMTEGAFVYDPVVRSMTEEGFVYDPVFCSGTEEGFVYDEHGFRVETEEDVADDIASFCAEVKVLQDEAAALASRPGGNDGVADVRTKGVAGDEDDVIEEAAFAACFGPIIDSVEKLLEDDEDSSLTTKGSSTS